MDALRIRRRECPIVALSTSSVRRLRPGRVGAGTVEPRSVRARVRARADLLSIEEGDYVKDDIFYSVPGELSTQARAGNATRAAARTGVSDIRRLIDAPVDFPRTEASKRAAALCSDARHGLVSAQRVVRRPAPNLGEHTRSFLEDGWSPIHPSAVLPRVRPFAALTARSARGLPPCAEQDARRRRRASGRRDRGGA
jgi:hypothetical protein